jgi:hypothetical protein
VKQDSILHDMSFEKANTQEETMRNLGLNIPPSIVLALSLPLCPTGLGSKDWAG